MVPVYPGFRGLISIAKEQHHFSCVVFTATFFDPVDSYVKIWQKDHRKPQLFFFGDIHSPISSVSIVDVSCQCRRDRRGSL